MTTEKEILITITLGAPRRGENWRNTVYLLPEERRVELQSMFGGGQTMLSYHGRELHLVDIPKDVADTSPISELLEAPEGQEVLATILDGYTKEWDGSNHVGRLTDESADQLRYLREELESLIPDLPCYTQAADWFRPALSPVKILELIESHGGIEAAAAAEVSSAAPEHQLEAGDVEVYLADVLRQLVADGQDEEDEDAAARAKALLGAHNG